MGLVSLMATAQQQTESFDFSGSVSGNNGWTKSTGTAGEIKTTDGSLTYSTITSVGNKLSIVNGSPYEAIYLPLSQPITTTFYMSFLINVADLATVQTSTTGVGGFFMTLSTSSTLESSNRVYIKGGSEPNTYILGFGNNTGPANTGLEDIYGKSPKNLELNTTYFVVVKYDMTDTGVKSSLWINPTSS
ncbi:MAG: hypothetical protein Q4C75_06230, partial [Bergeyella zoohelcum]|nr:hypothetical protein [Bergeyella zoohelcum]